MQDSIALSSLREATCGRDVKNIIDTYGQAECNKAWKQLSPVERASLQLANFFHGEIIHDYAETRREESIPDPVRNTRPSQNEW
tara:strand:- start:1855 stop:2106 length:252 start_codon:yes stop_codon:yes gene_type:complete